MATGAHRRFATARRAFRAAIAIGVAAAGASAGEARADLDVYPFSGTITQNDLQLLFPGKSVGQTFYGNFTIDTDATLGPVGNDGTLANWEGAFAVRIEGISHPVSIFRVWSSGPDGIVDGFEFGFETDVGIGFLALRSSQEIYLLPLVPTSVDLADMDVLARISLSAMPPPSDRGEIEQLPEPAAATSTLAAIAMVLSLARRRASPRGTRRGSELSRG